MPAKRADRRLGNPDPLNRRSACARQARISAWPFVFLSMVNIVPRPSLVRLSLAVTLIAFGPLAAQPGQVWKHPPGWTQTRGGDAGRTIVVTTLAASGPGSIAEALAADGARTVVFRVGGVIDLSGRSLSIHEPNVTIAGETAPSPGITIIQGGISIATHDVVLRHIRVRPGTPRGGARDVDGNCGGTRRP